MSKKGELLKAIAVLVLSVAVFVQAISSAMMRKEIEELWFRHDIIRQEIESLYKARYRLENELQRLEEEGIKVNSPSALLEGFTTRQLVEELFRSKELHDLLVKELAEQEGNK